MTQIAQRQLKTFRQTHDQAMLEFARHAALPVALNSDLLHLIRINFFTDGPQRLDSLAELNLLDQHIMTSWEIKPFISRETYKIVIDKYTSRLPSPDHAPVDRVCGGVI